MQINWDKWSPLDVQYYLPAIRHRIQPAAARQCNKNIQEGQQAETK